jgi:hyperosmotically inducible periplasmic protein
MRKLIRCSAIALGLFLVASPLFAQAGRDTSTMVRDGWITTQIYAKFFVDPDIKGRNIDVETVSGVVTLRGSIQSGAERNKTVAKAKSTEGVKQVVDKLTLPQAEKPPAGESPDKTPAPSGSRGEQVKAHAKSTADRVGKEISDTWITTKVQAMYFLDKDVKGMAIDVTTKAGVVTLTGTVPTEATRQKAVADARSIEGVSQVVDKLTVKR